MNEKYFNHKVKVLDEQNRIIEMIGSTESYDRVGDRMIMSGVDLKNYNKNPVILANHSYGSGGEKPTCIGKALNVSIQNKQLIFKIKFAETENAKDWFNLYAGGYMNASSIGFIPIKYTPNDQGGYDFQEWQLLELSLVAVPANQDCVQRAYDEKKISKALFDLINKNEKEDTENMKVEEVQALIDKAVETKIADIKKEHEKEVTEKVAEKVKEVETLTETVKTLEAQLESKTGASLSKATLECLTKACEGMTAHIKTIKDMCDSVKPGADDPVDEEKEYTDEEIQKMVQENIEKLLKEAN